MENKVVFYKNSNMHQVETKALPKISPNSYKFIFITFKGTKKIPEEEEIKKRQSVFNKSVKCNPIGKCVIEIGVETDQSKEDETYVKENNNGQSLSKNGSFKEKKMTHYELLDLEENKEKSKSLVTSVECEKNSLSVKCKSDQQSKNKLHKHSAKDAEYTFQQNEDKKEDTLDKSQKLPKKNCQLTSTILKLKDRVMNNPLFAEEDREFQKVSGDDGNECENVKKPDLERTEEPSKELLDDSKNLHLNEEHTTETKRKKENQTNSLHEDEGRFERSNEDNRDYTLDNSKEVSRENNQLNLTILKLKDRITQTKNLLPHKEDAAEFQERNEANNLFQKSEDTFASESDLGELESELSRVKSRQPHDLENLDAIEKKKTEENDALSSKIVKKEKNEAVITKKLLNEEEINEISKEHNENNGKNKFSSENKPNVDVTEVPRIKTVKSHDCVKNLAVTLKCISEKNCLVSPLFENKNKAKEAEIKKNILSEAERKSRLQEENEDNFKDISEEEYKRTYKNCTELQRTDEDDPEKDYPVSFMEDTLEDTPVAEEIFSSELQEQNAANNLFQKNEDKFDSNLVQLPSRIRCTQPHDSQQLDVIEDNETEEDYALPSKILKENENDTGDTNKLLSEEETNDKERNENNVKNKPASENELNVHVTEIPRIKAVESHDCVKNLAVTQKCISEKICTLPSLPEDRNKSKEAEFKKILLSEEERKSRSLQEENEDNSESISERDHKRTDENCTGLSKINENDRKEDCSISSIDLKTSKLHERIIKDTSEKMKQVKDKEESRNSDDRVLDEDRVENHHARQINSTQICNPSTIFEPNNGFLTKNEIFSKNTATEKNNMAINEPEIQYKKEILEVAMTVKSKKRSKSYDCIQQQKKKKKIELVERNKTSLDKINTFLDKSETFNSENLNVSEKMNTSQNMGLFEQYNDEQMILENIEQNDEDIVQTSKKFLCTGNKNEELIKLAEAERKKLSVTHENLEEFNENSHPMSQQDKMNESEDDDSESIKINKNKVTMRSKKARRKVSSKFPENSSTQTEHSHQLKETEVSKKINVISNELLNPLKKQIEKKAINEAEDEEGNVNFVKETRSEKRQEKTRLTQKRIRDYFAKKRRKSVNKQDLTIEEIEKDRSVSSHYSFQSLDSTSEESQNQSINEQKSDDCLREKLINKITHAIDKVIHENEHLGVSHQVNVNVDVKKVDRVESTEEEVVVSYKKCLNKQNNEVSNVRKENKKAEDDPIPGSSLQTPKRVEEKEGSDYANETYFDDNEGEEEGQEQRLKDEEPIAKMIKKLDGLKITIHWSLPPLHQMKVITGVLTNEQKQELTDQGVTIKTGKFTTLEDETIKSNWTEFCKQHDLPSEPSPFLNFSHLKGIHFPWEERLNFVRFIAHGLSNRTLQSVYRRFQKLKTEMKTGRFTEKEDEIIMKYMKNSANDKHYAHLATILNRGRNAVYKRHKILMTEDKVKKIKWNEKQITEFMKHLFKISNCNCTEDLKERDITSEEWNKLSQKMNIPNQKLRRVWFNKIYPRLFIENKMNTNEVKKKLIKILLDREEDDWKNVKWEEIAEDFSGLTGQYLYYMFKATVRYHVPKQHHMSLKECLKHLKIKYSGWPKVNKEISKLDLDESYLITDEESDTSI